jgi:ethanolamine transporter
MSVLGDVVIAVVMLCAVAGAIASLFKDDEGLGKEFLEGLRAIGHIFIPVAGIMALIPLLAVLIRRVLGPAFSAIGADPAMAATTFIASDMGGYQLASTLATTPGSWIMAMLAGLMAGATIVFSIPVGLALLRKRDHKYLALGMMSGLLSIPLGLLIASLLLMAFGPSVRPLGGGTPVLLTLTLPTILFNLVPLALVVTLLAVGLRFFPNGMVRGFMGFGRGMDVLLKLVLVAAIVQHFTGVFSRVFGGWPFDPVLAHFDQVGPKLAVGLPVTEVDLLRALEVAGLVGMMLAGAFPMVHLIKKYLARPLETVGQWLGLRAAGAAGLLAAAANILAMFHLVKEMRARDKVLVIAFAVCSAFVLGDHLAFTATFQPNLLLPVMLGKLGGGACGFLIALWLSVPRAEKLEKEDEEADVRALLAHVPLLRDRQFTITPIEGMTNRNYRLTLADGESYILRIARPEGALLGIDRDREAACTRAAADAGVAPEVVTYLPEQITLIRCFVEGQPLIAEDLRQPRMLRNAAEALQRCHAQPAPAEAAAFSPFATARSYLERAREHEVALPTPAELDQALKLLGKLEEQLQPAEPPCLCHNDLLPANFIDDGQRVWIIDWEYAGRGDRFFDLGNLAVNGEFNEEEERQLLQIYFGEVRPEDLRRLKRMRLVSDFREAMWGYLQSAISSLHEPSFYRDYGRRHLDRFLTAAGQRV